MSPNRTPRRGQVYRSPSGRPCLYVRTEKRPGRSEEDHLFVEAGDRVVLERWVPGGTLPDGYELALDPEATARADEVERELVATLAKADALGEALKRAVATVPVEVANELRRVYREELGRLPIG